MFFSSLKTKKNIMWLNAREKVKIISKKTKRYSFAPADVRIV